MTERRNKHENPSDDAYRTMDRMVDDHPGDNLDSPMMFALWVLGLFGIGAAAFVLSALLAAH
jgi:hypothetical protein